MGDIKRRVSHKNPCTICGNPGIPGLKKGHGMCQAHWNAQVFGTQTLVVYCRSPQTGAVRELNRFPYVNDLTAKEMLERYGIRDHLKAVVVEPNKPDWIIQNFPSQ